MEAMTELSTSHYTLAEKIGQMVMVGFRGTEVDDTSPIVAVIRDWHLGGVWLTDNENELGIINGNIRAPGQVRRLVDDLQARARLPLFIAIDAEGGQVIRLKEKFGFPPTLSAQRLGRTDDLALTRQQAGQIAALLKDLGINLNLVPVLDLNLRPDNPALGKKERCFSADPEVVIRHATAIIDQHRRAGIFCAGKHFPGHGSARQDSHHGFVDVTETWSEAELLPYERLIRSGRLDAVISAHIYNARFDSDHPATLSRATIDGLLRQRLQLDGLVISDDLNMGAIQYNYDYETAIALALNAGVDIVLQSNVAHYDAEIAQHTLALIRNLVESSQVPEARIDESFARILRLKQRLQSVRAN